MLLIFIQLESFGQKTILPSFISTFSSNLLTSDFELKNKVKSIVETVRFSDEYYKINKSNAEYYKRKYEDNHAETNYLFNENGFLTKRMILIYNEKDSLVKQWGETYSISTIGDSIYITEKQIPDSIITVKMAMNSHLQIINSVAIKENNIIGKGIHSYDKLGNITKFFGENFIHKTVTLKTYSNEYGDKQQLVKITLTEPNQLTVIYMLTYNDKGEIVKIKTNYQDNIMFDERNYQYDEKGNKIREEYYGVSETIGYNGEGNLESFSDTTRNITFYEFEYDIKGNWIKKTMHSSGNDTITWFRKIDYYD